MAHFAKLGPGNIVERVEVVANEVIMDSNQQEQENLGVEFLRNLYNDNQAEWKQTSYNGNFRQHFASPGFHYDAALDKFIPPKTFSTWILNTDTYIWEAPVAKPNDGKKYYWDNNAVAWKEKA